MKKYQYTKKKVEFGWWTPTAIFPRKHSTIKGLIYNVHNISGFGDFPNYFTNCYVLWKNKKDWEEVYQGDSEKFKFGTLSGRAELTALLFELETENVKEAYAKGYSRRKKVRMEKIAKLEKEIEKKTKKTL